MLGDNRPLCRRVHFNSALFSNFTGFWDLFSTWHMISSTPLSFLREVIILTLCLHFFIDSFVWIIESFQAVKILLMHLELLEKSCNLFSGMESILFWRKKTAGSEIGKMCVHPMMRFVKTWAYREMTKNRPPYFQHAHFTTFFPFNEAKNDLPNFVVFFKYS